MDRKNRYSALSLLITVVVCCGLLLSCVSHITYADNSAIKQKLSELAALIDKEPPFSFRNGMVGKLRFQEEIKQIIVLVDSDKVTKTKITLRRLLSKTKTHLVITNSVFKEAVHQRLLDMTSTIN